LVPNSTSPVVIRLSNPRAILKRRRRMDYETMKRQLVETANRNQDLMRGMTSKQMGKFVKGLIDTNDVAWGVFGDSAFRDGVGVYLIKGKNALGTVVASGQPEALRITAIPCVELEQAVAAEKTWGDGAPEVNN
jgi:hypothetical protein